MELSQEKTPKIEDSITATPQISIPYKDSSINPITTIDTVISSSDDETLNMLPQDGGAKAWLVVVGSFFIHSILWHLYVTQGVLFGIGASLSYYPAIAVPSHHFTKRRGLATGLAVSGVGVGGLVLAPLTHWFIDRVGVFWTLRILALLCLVVCGLASLLLVENKAHKVISQPSTEEKLAGSEKSKEETSEAEPGFFAALKVFKDPRFLSLSLAELIVSIAFLIPLYYMQRLSAGRGALILGLSNGASFVGRIALGTISDYVSNTKVLLFCSWMTAFTILVLWTLSHSFGLFLLVGLFFGFFGGGYISLIPVAVSKSFGTKQIASTIGLMYAAGGFGMLGGAPLAGFLLDITKPNISYLPVTLTAGLALALGSLLITLWAYLEWKVKRGTTEIKS
ncbi:hypothetical protein BGZ76_003197 [Entomortierella beljakovae]|nr:hypothetical protein BGZ76_003197 [Entomortierella beljakovae]